MRSLLVWTAMTCAILGGSGVARAQTPVVDDKAAAEALYEQGHALDEQGQYLQACGKYAESLRLDPGIGVMLHLAACWEKAGRPASAWGQYREAEQVAARAGDTRAEVARKHADTLEARLFRLTIVVPSQASVEGLAVVRDGEAVGVAQWGAPVPVDPGPHTIVAMARGKKRWETTFVAPDQPGSATLTVPALAAAEPNPDTLSSPAPGAEPLPSRPSPWGTQRIAAVAVGAAGIVGIGVGSYFGILTKVKLDQSNTSGCAPDNHCTATGTALRNDAVSAGRASTVAFAVGLAGLAGGAVLWLTAPQSRGLQMGLSAAADFGGAVVGATW